MNYLRTLLITVLLLHIIISANCQENDSIPPINKPADTTFKSIDTDARKNYILDYAMRLIKKKPDTINRQGLLITRSEEAFKPYAGKIIRNIVLNKYKFEKTFTDTSKTINYFGTRILNALHNNTKEWAIRNNLFIRENTPVNPFLLADNERFLRTLDYIQDARIIVQPKTGSPDSVDIYVITKDLFSINGSISNASTGKFRGRVEDANLFGAAQSLGVEFMIQKDRNPVSGYGIRYTKSNVLGTFIDASLLYSTIYPDIRNGTRDEHILAFSIERNLVSQYKHFAGGVSWEDHKSYNNYGFPDSVFFGYHYKLFDVWLGYNLGVRKYLYDKKNLNRKFISLRYLNTNFLNEPKQVNGNLFFRFNNRQAVLGQITFFRQEFYKTNFLYGFGTTEDVPTGYNVAIVGGWYKQSFLSRPYLGIDANRYQVYNKGDIIQYFLRAGGFLNRGSVQDAGILAGLSAFSRPASFKGLKLRQYMRFTYTHLYNRTGIEALGINNTFGIRYFRPDSVIGDERLSLHSETISFINYKVFGFKLSPFIFGDIAAITSKIPRPDQPVWYYGLGGGLRARNENLVFRTAEFRFIYFPRAVYGMPEFQGRLVVNLQFRYNTNYVRKPDIIQFNSDYSNNIF